MTDCYELGKHSVEITPKWLVGKELDWLRLNERKTEMTKKIMPMYFAILNECTFSVLYKYINKYIIFLFNNYMHLKI